MCGILTSAHPGIEDHRCGAVCRLTLRKADWQLSAHVCGNTGEVVRYLDGQGSAEALIAARVQLDVAPYSIAWQAEVAAQCNAEVLARCDTHNQSLASGTSRTVISIVCPCEP